MDEESDSQQGKINGEQTNKTSPINLDIKPSKATSTQKSNNFWGFIRDKFNPLVSSFSALATIGALLFAIHSFGVINELKEVKEQKEEVEQKRDELTNQIDITSLEKLNLETAIDSITIATDSLQDLVAFEKQKYLSLTERNNDLNSINKQLVVINEAEIARNDSLKQNALNRLDRLFNPIFSQALRGSDYSIYPEKSFNSQDDSFPSLRYHIEIYSGLDLEKKTINRAMIKRIVLDIYRHINKYNKDIYKDGMLIEQMSISILLSSTIDLNNNENTRRIKSELTQYGFGGINNDFSIKYTYSNNYNCTIMVSIYP